MRYDFDTWASHENNGNMKGAWATEMAEGGVMLSGAEMDYAIAPCVREALADFSRNGLFGLLCLTGTIKNPSATG